MAPLLIGSSNLLIDEMVRRRRVGDFRLPMKGHAEQLELVIDQRAALHPNRQRGKYLKLKCGRGDLFEITRIRKKTQTCRGGFEESVALAAVGKTLPFLMVRVFNGFAGGWWPGGGSRPAGSRP